MAQTAYSNVTNQVPALWATELLAQAENLTFWHRFEGPPGSGMPIIRHDDLTKTAGDTIKFDLVMALTGAGQTGDTTTLAGNEEALNFRQMSVVVAALAHGVRWTELVEQVINHEMRSTGLNQLQKWLAGKIDAAIWTELTGTGTTLPATASWYAGTATTDNTIADTDAGGRLKLNDITDIKAYAQVTPKIEPLRTADGNEYFGLVVHPYVSRWLKEDTNYQQAVREAQVRGSENPLFTGSTFVWDGVIGYVSNRVPVLNNANSPVVQIARNVFFGAQALSHGFAQYPDWREELFDYGRQAGIATTLIKGVKANIFDLSAANDGSLNTCIGHMILNSAAVAPVA